MLRRYTFLASYFILLSALTWWSGQLHSASNSSVSVSSDHTAQFPKPGVNERRELLETLDDLVTLEHDYRSANGRFTRMTQQLGYTIPSQVKEQYEFRVLEASRGRLRIIAFSEFEGRTLDLVSVDQDFQLQANFPLSMPRLEVLKEVANKHLRKIYEEPAHSLSVEQSLFKGYFRYEMSEDLGKPKLVSATGIKIPVLGLRLELSAMPQRGGGSSLDRSYSLTGQNLSTVLDAGSISMEVESVDQNLVELGRYPSAERKPIEIEEIVSIEKKH